MSLFDHNEASAARLIGVHPRTLRGYRKQGLIGHFCFPGGRIRYSTEQVSEFIATTRMRATNARTYPPTPPQL